MLPLSAGYWLTNEKCMLQGALLVAADTALPIPLWALPSPWAHKLVHQLKYPNQLHQQAEMRPLQALGRNNQKLQCSTGWARRPH